MTTVSVIRPGGAMATRNQAAAGGAGRHPKMTIAAEGGVAFVVPFAPTSTSFDGVVPGFATIERGGRTPLLLESSAPLRVISFELVLGKFSPNSSVETELSALTQLARSGARMKVTLDRRTNARLWRMTAFSAEILGRQHGTNAATRARVSITLTQASDVTIAVGPVSGGAKGKASRKRPKTYTVKRGDTLSGIAKKYYGNTKAWRRIADANKIKKPKNIKVGRKLKLP